MPQTSTPPGEATVAGRVWLLRYIQSNLVIALLCLLAFFLLGRGLLSLQIQEIASIAVLIGWQGVFLLCLLARWRLPWLWPAARDAAVALFVGWQLFFLVARNVLDFWSGPVRAWCVRQDLWDRGVGPALDAVDDATARYANFNGIDQNWRMFPPPLARSDAFLAVRITFDDGSDVKMLSDNEPDPRGFFRFGGWRQRRLEDVIVDDREPVLAAAYVRWTVRRWRERNPADPRTPALVTLLRREVDFPEPGADPAAFDPPAETSLGSFLPDGSPD